jgi:hypothetical protein
MSDFEIEFYSKFYKKVALIMIPLVMLSMSVLYFGVYSAVNVAHYNVKLNDDLMLNVNLNHSQTMNACEDNNGLGYRQGTILYFANKLNNFKFECINKFSSDVQWMITNVDLNIVDYKSIGNLGCLDYIGRIYPADYKITEKTNNKIYTYLCSKKDNSYFWKTL